MRGINYLDLVAIIDFLYYGEANLYQDDIDNFLAVAEELELKGLAGEGNELKDNETHTTSRIQEVLSSYHEPVIGERKKSQQDGNKYKPKLQVQATNCVSEQKQELGNIVAIPNSYYGEISKLDEQINLLMVTGQNPIIRKNGQQDKSFICQICGKEGNKTNIIDHIESNHIGGIALPCQMCEKTFRSRHMIRNHK